MANKKLSYIEKDKLIKEVLGSGYSNVGDRLPVLRTVLDTIDQVDTAFTLAELITYTNAIISSSRILSVVASGASVISLFLMPVASMINVINAWETGHRMYAYRAIAYTITAWTFNKPNPASSQTILHNLRSGRLVRNQSVVKQYNEVWRKTSQNVLKKIQSAELYKDVPNDALKIVLRALSGDNKQKLCLLLLKGFENQFDVIPKISWKSNYKILYPL